MSKDKDVKYQTVKYTTLPLFDNPNFATHTIAGGINDAAFKDFRDFLAKVHEHNKKINDEVRENTEKTAFNKVNDPEAKPVFYFTKPKIERINLIVDSRGGSCSSMTNIVALMNNSSIPIDTYCFGTAMSAGFMIFIHGKRRYISGAVDFMTHSLSSSTWDDAHAIKRYGEHVVRLNDIYQGMISEKTGLTLEWIKANQERDVFMTYEEVLEHKIADVLVVS